MKTLKKISLLFVLFFLYTFILSQNYVPKTIAVKGEEVKISEIQVIPVGEVVGIKLYTTGILVVGTSAIQGIDGITYKPFENTEIKEGDTIISINENIVNNTNELIEAINACNGKEIQIKYIDANKEKQCTIQPIKDPKRRIQNRIMGKRQRSWSWNCNIL